ncbi:hypothetical protein BJV41_000135 [Clostridium beijerinckii]|nr:hypothetical protein [Clostridium beijerinckii]OOM49378.1 hypothetical protein CBEIJ_14440 [Clostridium beijerinckii]
MNYPIPSHIKEVFQLTDANNSEYKVKGKLNVLVVLRTLMFIKVTTK